MTGDGRPRGGGLADGRYVAVVDRFEERDPSDGPDSARGGKLAVLLLESDEEVVAERALPAWRLPEGARRQDAVLAVRMRNGFVVSMEHDPEATERRGSAAQARFDRLAERPGEDSGGDAPDGTEPDGNGSGDADDGA